MKKRILYLMLIAYLIIPYKVFAVAATLTTTKVHIYVFNDNKEQINWLDEKYEDNEYIWIEYLDIEENKELYNKLTKTININKNKYPLIIIGDKYYNSFKDKDKNDIDKTVNKYLENAHCDLVSKIKNNESLKGCDVPKTNKNSILILGIMIALVTALNPILVNALIIINKSTKKKKDLYRYIAVSSFINFILLLILLFITKLINLNILKYIVITLIIISLLLSIYYLKNKRNIYNKLDNKISNIMMNNTSKKTGSIILTALIVLLNYLMIVPCTSVAIAGIINIYESELLLRIIYILIYSLIIGLVELFICAKNINVKKISKYSLLFNIILSIICIYFIIGG